MDNLQYHFEALAGIDPLRFRAGLYERGKPLVTMDFGLIVQFGLMTSKIESHRRERGLARRLLDLTIPTRLSEIAANHGSFEHQVFFTDQGKERLFHIFQEKGYAISPLPYVDVVRRY